MSDAPYTKREIDNAHDTLHEKLDSILTQVTYTNGKVKRIILAMVLLTGVVLGSADVGIVDIIKSAI